MNRLKGVGVGVSVGEKGAGTRPPGDSHREEKGDGEYREVTLTYDKAKKVATGEIDFPKDSDGRACWAQIFYSNTLTGKRFLAGKPLPDGSPPVEQVATELAPRFPTGTTFKLAVTHTLDVRERVEKEGVLGVDLGRRALSQEMKLKEFVDKVKGNAAHAQLECVLDADGLAITANDSDGPPRELLDAKDTLVKWGTIVTVGHDGKAGGATAAQVGFAPTADRTRQELAYRLANQLANTTAEATAKLPGKRGEKVNPGQTWTDTLTHRFKLHPLLLLADPPGKTSPIGSAKEVLTYTYLGRRDRGGRAEAVIKVDGVLYPMKSDSTPCGSVEGRIVVDEKTGVVMEADYRREFDLDASSKGVTLRCSGTEEVKIRRAK